MVWLFWIDRTIETYLGKIVKSIGLGHHGGDDAIAFGWRNPLDRGQKMALYYSFIILLPLPLQSRS